MISNIHMQTVMVLLVLFWCILLRRLMLALRFRPAFCTVRIFGSRSMGASDIGHRLTLPETGI